MPWGGGDDKGGFGHLFLLYPHVLELEGRQARVGRPGGARERSRRGLLRWGCCGREGAREREGSGMELGSG